ncbi:glycerophosphodiester phosphodiesterase [Fodinibius saliphilus]|uniref:glycerophosphodiester phosphodiesterase n=1 Tax=Fodinibius saliphilus TaxID=1920650 RepID=UPI0011084AF3|nr:glycerophosphodiester phosphodiesterase family protein [Fodinibius saliphilus]
MAKDPNLPLLYSDDGDGFIVIAHRGASAYYPENTMPAFEGAVAMNAEMIELDVLMSKDGVPVVFHDLSLDNHTDGNGYVPEYTLSELKKLDSGSWFSKNYAGQQIPTLEEVLQFAAGKIALNIEIKTEAVSDIIDGGVEQKSLELVKQYGMEEHVLFSSFDYRVIKHLKKLDPTIPVALLYNKHQSKNQLPHQQVREFSADAFNCSFRQFSKKWARDLREHGIPHFIYTVNSKRKMKKLIKSGVTGIFTNKPDVLHQVKDRF